MQLEQDISTKNNDLRKEFVNLRHTLAGISTGITRDETLTEELLKFLFCKIYSENTKSKITTVSSLKAIFKSVVKEYGEIFKGREKIKLDDVSLEFLIKEFGSIDLHKLGRNPISDLIEIFINSTIKGAEGQFFTPDNAVEMIYEMLNPSSGSSIIDPACGCGNFLVHLLVKDKFKNRSFALYGVDKDDFLSFVARAYMTLLEETESNVFCTNSLESFDYISKKTGGAVLREQFDYVVTNPPYGAKIDIGSNELKAQFDLSYKWKQDKKDNSWVKEDVLQSKPAPQIVFIERCIDLAKPGGYIGLVLPEGIFSNPSSGYLREYILRNCKLEAMVSFPEELFKTSGKGGTHTKTCAVILRKFSKKKEENYDVFLGRAIRCGHDSRGLKTPFDDLPKISERYLNLKAKKSTKTDHLGFYMNINDFKNNTWLPKYYDPEIFNELKFLEKTHNLVSLGELIKQGFLEIRTGDEVGKLAYGTGDIPFIRTSEITNWEIKTDNKHGISDEIYEKYSSKQDVQCGDILMVKDGTYLVGSCAMVTEDDLPLVYQSHIYKIRSKNHAEIDPHLLLAMLSSPCVEKQIYSKRFTQDIIDTLGPRIKELVLPIPKSKKLKEKIISDVERIIEVRREARNISRAVRWDVLGSKYSKSFDDIRTKM